MTQPNPGEPHTRSRERSQRKAMQSPVHEYGCTAVGAQQLYGDSLGSAAAVGAHMVADVSSPARLPHWPVSLARSSRAAELPLPLLLLLPPLLLPLLLLPLPVVQVDHRSDTIARGTYPATKRTSSPYTSPRPRMLLPPSPLLLPPLLLPGSEAAAPGNATQPVLRVTGVLATVSAGVGP